ncbi:leucine-rich repeat-containing protein 15-like [Dendroctonus ponderosae]|uniref:leucine-rich repeat-containing protein 15-like n=1 Tax=Dendroctonus ponderosae TaxID=77166 RepID=UPI002035639C|nr:leucine-rich repeat-containing protein 15-like [Dendroctonus ponderosae]
MLPHKLTPLLDHSFRKVVKCDFFFVSKRPILKNDYPSRGLPRLRDLSIQHTPLETVSPFAFAGLQNISAIFLSYNKIKKVESYAFAGTINLKQLVLAHNPLLKLESNAFTGMTEIDRITLPSGIRTLEADCFNGLDTLGHLQLAFMDLRHLKGGIFRGLTNVNYLSIQESDLGNIEGDAFNDMTFVRNLNILNNKIDSIQWLNFTWEQHVGHLRFQGNHILEIPRAETLLVEVEKLTVIQNHFPCDCHVHSLLDGPLANGSMIHFVSKNYCISPLEVNGLPMSSIDIDSIGRCQEEVTRGNLEASKDSSSSAQRLSIFCSYLNLMLYFLKLLRIT